MNKRICIALLLIFRTFTLLAQEIVTDSVIEKEYLKSGWKFSKAENRYVEYEVCDTIYSTNQKNKVIRQFIGLPDNVTKAHYYLIRTEYKDTTKLLSSEFRDRPAPNFKWLSTDYLIYEGNEYSDNEIYLRNLRTNEIEYSVSGIIPVDSVHFENFFDLKNQILIFFQYGNNEIKYIPDLMSFNYRNGKVVKLITFNTPFDFDIPIVKLDTDKRKLWVQNGDFSAYDLKEVEVKY